MGLVYLILVPYIFERAEIAVDLTALFARRRRYQRVDKAQRSNEGIDERDHAAAREEKMGRELRYRRIFAVGDGDNRRSPVGYKAQHIYRLL